MAQLKKLFRVSMIIDHSILHELMTLADGKAIAGSLDIRPVKHGGADDNGKLQSAPTGREFMLAFVNQNPRFRLREAIEAAEPFAISKAVVYSAVNTMTGEGVLKRIGVGEYTLASKRKAAQAKKTTQGKPARPGGKTVTQRILAAVGGLQNGSGGGVTLKQIKTELAREKPETGVSPAITALLRQKRIERVGKSQYRLAAQ